MNLSGESLLALFYSLSKLVIISLKRFRLISGARRRRPAGGVAARLRCWLEEKNTMTELLTG